MKSTLYFRLSDVREICTRAGSLEKFNRGGAAEIFNIFIPFFFFERKVEIVQILTTNVLRVVWNFLVFFFYLGYLQSYLLFPFRTMIAIAIRIFLFILIFHIHSFVTINLKS